MNANSQSRRDGAETAALIVVSLLLILTSTGNAELMMGFAMAAMVALFIRFLTNRKTWLAIVSAIVFLTSVIVSASRLY